MVLPKTPGVTGCAHCQALDATPRGCAICGRPICRACAAKPRGCPVPHPRELRLGLAGRLRDVDPAGRVGLYSRVGLALFDLEAGVPLPGRLSLLAAGDDKWLLLPHDELLWVDWGPLDKRIDKLVFLRRESGGERKQVAVLAGDQQVDVLPRSLRRSEHGSYALLLRSDEVIDVLDTRRRALQGSLRVPGQVLQVAAASEAAGLIVAASFGQLFVFGLTDGRLRGQRKLPDGDVLWLDVSATLVGAAVEGGHLELLRIAGHPRAWQPLPRSSPLDAGSMGNGLRLPDGAALSPDGRLWVRGRGSVVELWTLTGAVPQLGQTLRAHTDAVHFVRFTGDGQRLVTADRDNRVVLWPRSGDRVLTLEDAREARGLR